VASVPLCIATRNRFYLCFQNKLRNNEGTMSMAFHYPLYSDNVTSSRTKHHLELFKTMPNRTLFNRPPNLCHRSLVKTRHTQHRPLLLNYINTPSIPNYKTILFFLKSHNISSLTKIIERNTKIYDIK